MVNDVAKLTDSLRRSVVRQRATSSLQNLSQAAKQRLLAEIDQNGRAVYTDNRGNRYQIERKPA